MVATLEVVARIERARLVEFVLESRALSSGTLLLEVKLAGRVEVSAGPSSSFVAVRPKSARALLSSSH